MSENLPTPPERQFLFYDTQDGITRVQMLVDGNTVWMPKKAIAELFDTWVANVNIQDWQQLRRFRGGVQLSY